jgi:hypothetical protein
MRQTVIFRELGPSNWTLISDCLSDPTQRCVNGRNYAGQLHRKRDIETAAGSLFALYPNSPTVLLDEVFRDRES